MHIRIVEKNGGWNLWAAETADPAAAPIYTAARRTREQIVNLLRNIVDDTPAPISTSVETEPVKDETPSTNRKAGAHAALSSLLGALDGWIEGAKNNHDALNHRSESRGEECWRNFAASDIRNMVNDAAREMGIAAFPYPTLAQEDRP
jgi:hypothetical protein